MQTVLEVAGFVAGRADGFTVALPELTLAEGEVAALFGPSGAGKTTLLEAMFGLLPAAAVATSGVVRLSGREFGALDDAERRRVRRTNMAWVTQDAAGALDPMQPIADQLRQATWRNYADCTAALGRLGIESPEALARRLPHQVSGGQAQRVLLAVAMLRRPQLLVADEPSASLDAASFELLCEALERLRAGGTAILLSTHDRRLLERLSARVLVADHGGAFVPGAPTARAWPQRVEGAGVGEVPVLHARDVEVRWDGRAVLDGVDLELHRGEVVALVGASGAGKTTLARVLAGHRAPDAGEVERPSRATAVQLLCQDALASLTPGRTLRSLLAEAHGPFFDPQAQAAQLALGKGVLERTGREMSGGERRRAALLRALAVNPDVLILDEPTASLDHDSAVAVLETLMALREQRGVALLLITHDRELAAAVANRTVELVRGRT